MKFIGIDIAKSTFVVAYPDKSGYSTMSFANNVTGIRRFIKSISASDSHCIMEATGNYGMLLLYMLSEGGYKVSMINPKQIKHFARMMMTVTKTDEVDRQVNRSIWRENDT